MDLLDQILKQARNFLICPVCNSHYKTEEIRFRGFIDSTYIFQGVCGKGHDPLAVTYLASLGQMGKPISAYFHTLSGKKISPELSSKAFDTIDKFDGNFKVIWPI